MPRKYKARDKKVHKMSRSGLIEQNAATGEIENISKREQDFSLRTDQPDGRDSSVRKDKDVNSGNQTGRNESLRKQRNIQQFRVQEQTADTQQNAHNSIRDISSPGGSSPEIAKYNLTEDINHYTDGAVQTDNNIPKTPAEAAKPIERSYTSPVETPPGKGGTDTPQEYSHETVKRTAKTETAEHHSRLQFTQDPAQTQNIEHQQQKFTPDKTPATAKFPQSDKLQFSRADKTNQANSRGKNRKNKKKFQTGNKYQQQESNEVFSGSQSRFRAAKIQSFTAEAAQPDKSPVLEYRQTEQAVQHDAKPETVDHAKSEAISQATQETPLTPTAPPRQQIGKNGKLQFVKESALGNSRKGKKPRKKGNKYQQRFTPEAAKPQPQIVTENAKPINTSVQDIKKPDNVSILSDLSKSEKAEPRQEDKQPEKAAPQQDDKQSEKAELWQDNKQPPKPEGLQADKKPVSNEVQPEKTQLRTDPKSTKLQEKPGKLKFDIDNPVKRGKQSPLNNKNKRRSNEKSADKQPVSESDKLIAEKFDKEKPLSDNPKPPADERSRQTEPSVSESEEKGGSSETLKKAGKSSKLKFTDDEKSVYSDKKLTQLQGKAEEYSNKLEKARDKLPSKKSIKAVRTFDDGKGKAKTRLQFEKEILPPRTHGEQQTRSLRLRPAGARKSVPASAALAKKGTDGLTQMGTGKLHQKIYEVENENVGVEAGHRVEQAAEATFRGGKRVTRSAFNYVRNRPYRTVEKLEKKAIQANIKYSYRKALSENPRLKSNVISRFMQKRKIKQQYAKAARDAKYAKNTVKKTGDMATKAVKAIVGAIKNHPAVAITIIIILLLMFFIASFLSALGGLMGTGLPAFVASSYLADDIELDTAELSYTEWETDLLMKIDKTEQDYPGYDEYRYQVDNIGHNPYELIAYLTAMYENFQYADIESSLQQIFDEQYNLSVATSVEIRYADPTDANADGNYEPYDWNILTVTLTSRSFTDVVLPRMNDEQLAIYSLLMQTKGNRQYINSPFDFNWLPNVTSYYGYRIHPTTGVKDYHKGVDISVPIGTEIKAGHDGKVTFAGYSGDYGYVVVIEDDKGLVSKYAHCDSVSVSVNQEVKCGDVIALSGNSGNSTGPHLHLEVLKNGQYLNPLIFAVTNDSGLSSPAYGYTPSPMGDGSYTALIEEAEKFLGYPYRWGGSSPSTSFDCSGFVSWVFNQSGAASFGRTTAQGLYNMTTPVSPSEAQPGDLIFFHSTYSSANTITHVGIYVGGGYMVHAGDPIQYTSINTSYWQSHFFAFGRIN